LLEVGRSLTSLHLKRNHFCTDCGRERERERERERARKRHHQLVVFVAFKNSLLSRREANQSIPPLQHGLVGGVGGYWPRASCACWVASVLSLCQARSGPSGALSGRGGVQGEAQPEGAAHACQQPHGAPGAHARDPWLHPLGGESELSSSSRCSEPIPHHAPFKTYSTLLLSTIRIPPPPDSKPCSVSPSAQAPYHLPCCGFLAREKRRPHTRHPSTRGRR